MSAPDRGGVTPLGWALALAVGVTAAGMIPAWLVGGLAVQMRDALRFDAFQLGATTSLFHVVSAIVSSPGAGSWNGSVGGEASR